MKYFQNSNTQEIFAYDADQGHLIDAAAKNPDMVDVTNTFTPVSNVHAISQGDTARLERERLLAASDWVVVKSLENGHAVPSAWAEYRQALRDIPQQAGFPDAINWPVAPSGGAA